MSPFAMCDGAYPLELLAAEDGLRLAEDGRLPYRLAEDGLAQETMAWRPNGREEPPWD